MGKLYGIGVGPGDPDLLTIKGKKLINSVDYLFCPVKKEGSESFAYEIIKSHLENRSVQIVELVYPMHYKEDALKSMWQLNGEKVTEMLSGDKSGAFITLGDPSVYSTFMYTMPYIDKSVVEVEVVPGITSFCATACAMGIPLVEWEEGLVIYPVRKNSGETLSKILRENDNAVFMKPASDQAALVEALRNNGLENNFALISKTGTEQQNVITDIHTLEQGEMPYLSTMVVKKKGIAKS